MRLFKKNNIMDTKEVTKADKVWFDSIVKRQYMVLEDLVEFTASYPDKLDGDVVGSLFALTEILRDANMSIRYSTNRDNVAHCDKVLF